MSGSEDRRVLCDIRRAEDFELVDEDDPEDFAFDKTFVETLHRLGVSAQDFLDTWTKAIDDSNREMMKSSVTGER